MGSKYSNLTEDDRQRLEAQREVVRLAAARYGVAQLSSDTAARANLLQDLIDDQVFTPSQTYELQSLGIVFGDILIDEGPFRWVIIEDEYGRDPTLQWKDTSVNIHALTILSKRIEDGERPDIQYLLDVLPKRCMELDPDADKANFR
jgi:hypothetical protein